MLCTYHFKETKLEKKFQSERIKNSHVIFSLNDIEHGILKYKFRIGYGYITEAAHENAQNIT
jgi:hypothetical protein